MQVEDAKLQDAAEILALQKLAYQTEAALYPGARISPVEQGLESLQAEFADKIVLKVVHQGRIIGSVRGKVQGDAGLVERFIVHPDFRRQGIGSLLLAALEARFAPAPYARLFTGSRSVSNLQMYAKRGYVETRREKMDEQLTFVWMEKKLSSR